MAHDPMAKCDALIAGLRTGSNNNYFLRWCGSKDPRGATIGGVGVGWTQHGRIVGEGGEDLGFYERLKEFGGDAGDEHTMLVSTNSDVEVIAPDGIVCPNRITT